MVFPFCSAGFVALWDGVGDGWVDEREGYGELGEAIDDGRFGIECWGDAFRWIQSTT